MKDALDAFLASIPGCAQAEAGEHDLLVRSNFFMAGREQGSYRLSKVDVNWAEAQAANNEN